MNNCFCTSVDGSPVGTDHNHGASTSYSSYTDDDVVVVIGDLVQLYVTSGGEGMFTQNFRILGDGINITEATLD